MTSDASRSHPHWAIHAAVDLIAVVALFYNLGDYRTFAWHEAFCVVPARQMIQSGDWVVPRFGDLPRLKKPPLAYWTVAASASAFGELTEWTARFPSAVAGLLLAGLIGLWTSRWYGRSAGLAAALVQATSVYVLTFARKCEVDMLLCLLMTAALFAVAVQPAGESRSRAFVRWIGIDLLLGLTWLAKFHYGAALVLAPVVVYWLIQRRYRDLRQLANPVGLVIFAACAVIWFGLVLERIPEAWDVWWSETVGRAMGRQEHVRPVWFYIPQILWLTLPWTPFALAAVPRSWRQAWSGGDPQERFLWVWLLVQLGIVTVQAVKHYNYILPALPVMSIWAGRTLADWLGRLQRGEWRLRPGHAVAWTLLSVSSGLGIWWTAVARWPLLQGSITILAAVWILGGCVAPWLLLRRHLVAAAGAVLGSLLICYCLTVAWIVPGQDHRRPMARFAREVRRTLSAEHNIGVYRLHMHPLAFYLDEPFSRFKSDERLAERLQRQGRLYVIALESDLPDLAAVGQTRVLRRMTVRPEEVAEKPDLRPVLLDLTKPETAQADLPSMAPGRALRN